MEIIYNNAKIHYRVEGKLKHNTLVLLHGFMESLDIWDIFSAELSIDFKVICIDLPGHGESECLAEVHTMELMADAVKAVLDKESIAECVMVGHSMGGYVTLAFAEKYPGYLKGLGLFHSSAFADAPSGKINRERAIAAIENNHLEFITNFIPDLFAPDKRGQLEAEINVLISRANKMSKQAIIAAQKGMLAREDKRAVLEKAEYPVLFIAGKQDTRVTFDIVLQQLTLARDTVALLLHDIAHMGYLESEEKTLYSIECFTEGAF